MPTLLRIAFWGKGYHFLKFESHSAENESFGEHVPPALGISSASLPQAAYPALQTSFEDISMCERVERDFPDFGSYILATEDYTGEEAKTFSSLNPAIPAHFT